MSTANGLSCGERTAVRIYRTLCYLSKRWFTHVLLALCLVMYSVAGAMVFMTLEGPNEAQFHRSFNEVRYDLASRLQDLYRNEAFVKNDTIDIISIIESDLLYYESNFTEYLKRVSSNNATSEDDWSFWSSLFYATSIYTTIGYGHIAPKTMYGRISTVVYAVIGIPLFFVVVIDFAKLFTRILKCFCTLICCKRNRKTKEKDDTYEDVDLSRVAEPFALMKKLSDAPPPLPPKPGAKTTEKIKQQIKPPAENEVNAPVSLALLILIVYIVIGTFGYNLSENWDVFESFYFVLMSVSTIGLGDLVPTHPRIVVVSILYLVFGVILVVTCINVVYVKLSVTLKKASNSNN